MLIYLILPRFSLSMKQRILYTLFLTGMMSALAFSQEFEVIFDAEPVHNHHDTVEISFTIKSPKDTIRLMIVEKAREYLGVNYQWGQSNENGFDCSGYVKYIFAQFGFTLPHSSYEQYNTSRRLTEHKAKPGDLVFFVTRGQRISHVGIYLGDSIFIHAPSKCKQVCVESLEKDYYKNHLAGFGSIL